MIKLALPGLIPIIWIIIHLIPIKETEITKELLNNQETISLDINGDVYLKGFNTPKGQSPTEYGYNLYKSFDDYTPNLEEAFELNDIFGSIKKDALLFQGNDLGLDCLYNTFQKDNLDCQSEEELNNSILQNDILLSRLKELWDYEYFDSDIPFASDSYFDGSSFIKLQQLFHSHLVLLKRNGKTDQAINLWLKNIKMLNAIIKGRYNLVDKAVIMVTLQTPQKAILEITNNIKLNPNQQKAIEEALLTPAFGPEGWDIKKTAQAEYNFIFNTLYTGYKNENLFNKVQYSLLSPGYAKNKLSKFYYDYTQLTELSPEKFSQEYERLSAHYDEVTRLEGFNIVKMMAYAPSENLLFGGIFKGRELFNNRFHNAIKNRVIILTIRARQNNIEKSALIEFLNNQPKEFQNPITQEPFKWDGENIYFINSIDEHIRYEVMY